MSRHGRTRKPRTASSSAASRWLKSGMVERQPDLKFRNELTVWLDHRLRPWFAGRILPVDEEVILEWRRMVARGREHAITFSQPDLFIAATAQVHALVVCTRNEDDFRQTGVPVFNPWMG